MSKTPSCVMSNECGLINGHSSALDQGKCIGVGKLHKPTDYANMLRIRQLRIQVQKFREPP
jgi:hypothetical protein